ncbi:hypothetical protein [Comamonas terrae]|uniref:Uncharacterized protein n=1 Tax=Comamonas terrae TaxID=673548 RepID=A0ABW5UMX8_9BURK|nr:hypothetical protein [Comamonas terrae]
MLDLDHDMQAVFYCSDFAMRFKRLRAGVEDLVLQGIIGVTDAEALEGHASTVSRTLQCPATVDMRPDDVLQLLEAAPQLGMAEGERFRVLDVPERINDGAEQVVLLGSAWS